MNGIHDMGGMHGFGPVQREDHEPVFHAEWEGKVVAMGRVISSLGLMNIDESRYGIEQLPPAQYLTLSYYERWLQRTINHLVKKGLIREDELDTWIKRLEADSDTPLPAPPDPETLNARMANVRISRDYRREGPEPRFHSGDHVLTRSFHPRGHTRLPRYARGKHGVVETVHGTFVFADTNGMGEGEQPQPLYTVRFTAQELWSDSAEPNSTVSLDMWESYLEPLAHDDHA
jgi:nitrile hydratase